MQIIIPMTGYGSRFVNAGYRDLKPFIKVYGKPILKWIVDGIFPRENEFLFICRKEHLDSISGMKEILLSIAPCAKIFAIDDWVKKGPVYDVLQASAYIKEEEPCIVNYCDFYMSWNWNTMKKKIIERGCEGCIPCYTGFHPHLLSRNNLYASCLTDSDDNLIEIREKYSFEQNKMKGKHSPGTYYFKSGSLLIKYFQRMIEDGDMIKGEYYASMPYNFMVLDGLKVWIPTDIDYFCQWGTPEDMEESLYWINKMLKIRRKRVNG